MFTKRENWPPLRVGGGLGFFINKPSACVCTEDMLNVLLKMKWQFESINRFYFHLILVSACLPWYCDWQKWKFCFHSFLSCFVWCLVFFFRQTMTLCNKNTFILAMDLNRGGGFCLSLCFPCCLSYNTMSTVVKISYATGHLTGTNCNWIKIQVHR